MPFTASGAAATQRGATGARFQWQHAATRPAVSGFSISYRKIIGFRHVADHAVA
jgi:hypothetical protein